MKKKIAFFLTLDKLILLFLAGFVLFNMFLFLYPLQKKNIYINKERAEEFIYSKRNYSVVFTGSGLLGDFTPASIGRENSFNLFFPYNGGCTGVKLIALSNKIPDTLFVEINYLFKGFDQQLIEEVFRPGLYQARFLFPALQEKHQLLSLLKENIKSMRQPPVETEEGPAPNYAQTLSQYKKDYQNMPDSLRLQQDLTNLKCYLDYIASKNCKILFFEMPVDRQLTNSPRIQFEKRTLQRILTNEKIGWIAPDTVGTYATADGIHLLKTSVYQYLAYLNRTVPQLASNR